MVMGGEVGDESVDSDNVHKGEYRKAYVMMDAIVYLSSIA